MSLRVVHVITTIDLGGAEKQLLTLATCQKRNGIEVEIIFLKDKPELLKSFLAAGIPVDTEFSKISFYRQVRKLKAKRGLSGIVFHAHLPRAELLCSLSLRKGSFIVTRHNSENFLPRGSKIFSQLLSRFVLKRAFASIAISRAVAEFLRKTSELGVHTRNEIVYYGIDASQIQLSERRLPQSNSIRLGTVARLVHQKNIPLLLNSLQILSEDKGYKWNLEIVGIGPLLDELKLLASERGIEDSIVWLGQTTKIIEFYNTLDVFVLTSNYEGFGLVLLEAMTQGVPVIARKISAIPEVLGVGHPGLIDSNDPNEFASRILKLARSKELREDFLNYQSIQLRAFSIEKAESLYRAIYRELLVTKK